MQYQIACATHIDVWHIPLHTDFAKAIANPLEYLDPAELTRYQRFYFDQDRQCFLNSRIATKQILANYLETAATQINFKYETYGKPYIQNAQELVFNLSHSHQMALLAIGKQHALGIDIEHIHPRNFHGLASHAFSRNEQEFLKQINSSSLETVFYNIWTSKEAFIKAIGLGLRYPIEQIDMPLLLPQQIAAFDFYHHKMLIDPQTQQLWHINSFQISPEYMGAICYHPTISHCQILHYDPTKFSQHLALA